MLIRLGYDIRFDVSQGATFVTLLRVRLSRQHQLKRPDLVSIYPEVPIEYFEAPGTEKFTSSPPLKMNGCPTTFDILTLRFETALTALILATKQGDGGSPLFGQCLLFAVLDPWYQRTSDRISIPIELRGGPDDRFRDNNSVSNQVEYTIPVHDPVGLLLFYDSGTAGPPSVRSHLLVCDRTEAWEQRFVFTTRK